MESLREILESKKIAISLCYYGTQDLATGWEIKSIVDNLDVFDDFYRRFPLYQIKSDDDLFLFFLSQKLSKLCDMIPLLSRDEHKEIIQKLSQEAKDSVKKIGIGPVIKYINANITEIFDNMPHDFSSVTVAFIASYSSGISHDAFIYFCSNYGNLLIDRFEDFETVFEKHPDFFSSIFPTGKLQEIDVYRFETVLQIWAHIYNKKNSNLKDIVEKKIPALFSDVKQLADSTTICNIMEIDCTIRCFNTFLQQIHSPLANDFAPFIKSSSLLLDERIQKHGLSFSYEIPVGTILSDWKTTENWQVRLLSLTHEISKEEKTIEFVSMLSKPSEGKQGIANLFSSNIPTDDYYTMSHQQMLSITASFGSGIILGITHDQEAFQDYLSLIASAIHIFSDEAHAEGENLLKDIDLLVNMIQLVFNNQNEEIITVNALSYGAAMFICAFSEKILRILYKEMVRDTLYVPVNKATFGELLRSSNPQMVAIFGEDHIKNLSFFLQQVPPENIGYNYRNSLAHWSNISVDMLTPIYIAQLLWLFTDILNTVFWHYLSKSQEEGDPHDEL